MTIVQVESLEEILVWYNILQFSKLRSRGYGVWRSGFLKRWQLS